jgi:hypothetical protein
MRLPFRIAAVSLLLACSGCAPSEDDIQTAFGETVADSNACDVDGDCDIASSDCPLGCWVAVRADRVEAVERRAAELIADYERGGTRCEYDCSAPGTPTCAAGRCTAEPE